MSFHTEIQYGLNSSRDCYRRKRLGQLLLQIGELDYIHPKRMYMVTDTLLKAIIKKNKKPLKSINFFGA